MINKVLVVVPHEDDEINLIGSINDYFIDNHILVDIVFITNGDFYLKNTKKRIIETLKVSKKMKINKVIFLGYPDKFIQNKECQLDWNVGIISENGYSETYGVGDLEDYRYQISGYHNKYNLNNLKSDMKECIYRTNADLIICNDFDCHPDHRMVSVIFDEVICELIKEKKYKPIVLKKYAYAGVWEGEKDYFIRPILKTKLNDLTNGFNYEKCPYSNDDIVSIKVDKKMNTCFFWNSHVYKLLKIYKSQHALIHFISIVNADDLFFFRNTNNLAIKADVKVSSGNGNLLNDFKLQDTKDFTIHEQIDDIYTWHPDKSDKIKTILFTLDKPCSIFRIVFHQSLDVNSSVDQVRIQFDNNEVIEVDLSKRKKSYISFEENKNVSNVLIKIIKTTGELYGFREIEIYEKDESFKWKNTPFEKYVSSEKKTYEHKILFLIYRINVLLKYLIPMKVCDYIKLKRKKMIMDDNLKKKIRRYCPRCIIDFFIHPDTFWMLLFDKYFPVFQNGVNSKEQRNEKIIVSLTSYPKRFDTLYITIKNIMRQTVKADLIILYLGSDSINTCIPSKLKKLEKKGLKIIYKNENIGSYKKIYYALEDYPNDLIITIDDDLLYERKMIEYLYEAYKKNPNVILAKRVHMMKKDKKGNLCSYNDWYMDYSNEINPSFSLFATTGAGTLFPPHIFKEFAMDKKIFIKYCYNADDVWIKFVTLRCGIKIKFVPGKWIMPKETVLDRNEALYLINNKMNKNDQYIKKLEQLYNIDLGEYAK